MLVVLVGWRRPKRQSLDLAIDQQPELPQTTGISIGAGIAAWTFDVAALLPGLVQISIERDGFLSASSDDGGLSGAENGDDEAAAFLYQLDAGAAEYPESLMDEAVEWDPYWRKNDDGSYTSREGATYDTPEKLIDAYKRHRRLGRDVPENG